MSLPSLKPSILGPGPIVVSASGMVSKSAPGDGGLLGPPAPDFGASPIVVCNFLYS